MTNAEMAVPSNYAESDTVVFNRRYKTLGVEKGDEREVAKVDRERNTVHLRDREGHVVEWRPYIVAARKGGVEVYRSEKMELRAGDRVRCTRNDPASGLVNGQVAEVDSIERDSVRFRLEDGSALRLSTDDPQLRYMDRAWASTAHAFQGRTVDNVIAAMEANHPHLTTQRTFYVAISRARDRAELVTDDAAGLSQHLEKATGEHVTALDAVKKYVTMEVVIGDEKHQEHAAGRDRRAQEAAHGRDVAREDSPSRDPEREPERTVEREATQESVERTDDRHEPAHRPDDPVRKGEREPEPSRTPERDPAHQTEKDPKEKKPELDFELELEFVDNRIASGHIMHEKRGGATGNKPYTVAQFAEECVTWRRRRSILGKRTYVLRFFPRQVRLTTSTCDRNPAHFVCKFLSTTAFSVRIRCILPDTNLVSPGAHLGVLYEMSYYLQTAGCSCIEVG